jgi:hypothetical protein
MKRTARAAAAAFICILHTSLAWAAPPAPASTPPPPDKTARADEASLAKARAAFGEADFDAAADAYNVAIDKGHLAPGELAECFLSVGISLASQGKSKKALDAFRLAVVVDPSVAYPASGPKKARPLLEQARKEMAKRAGDWFRVAVPERAAPLGQPAATARVRVEAVAGLEAVEVDARSGEGEPWVQRFPLAAETAIVLPRALHATGRVRMRIAAVDDVGNRWAELVRTVDVERTPDPRPAAAPLEAKSPEPPADEPAPRRRKREGGERAAAIAPGPSGFWSGPWPWVALGTIALGVGGAYGFAALDTSAPARVAAPTVTRGP